MLNDIRPSVIIDLDPFDIERHEKLSGMGYDDAICYYGCGYDISPVVCWYKDIKIECKKDEI